MQVVVRPMALGPCALSRHYATTTKHRFQAQTKLLMMQPFEYRVISTVLQSIYISCPKYDDRTQHDSKRYTIIDVLYSHAFDDVQSCMRFTPRTPLTTAMSARCKAQLISTTIAKPSRTYGLTFLAPGRLYTSNELRSCVLRPEMCSVKVGPHVLVALKFPSAMSMVLCKHATI